MRVGLDMDDTICSTNEVVKKYENKYCKLNNVDSKTLWKEEDIRHDFLHKYLKTIYNEVEVKKGAVKTINKIKELGHEVYVITARKNKYIDSDMKEFVKDYLSRNGIIVDDVIVEAKDKYEICDKLDIDIMLEDNDYNYYILEKEGFNVILFDDFNKHKDIKRRVTSWKDFLKYLK